MAGEMGINPATVEHLTPDEFAEYYTGYIERLKFALINNRQLAAWILAPNSPRNKDGSIKRMIEPKDLGLFEWEEKEKSLKDLTQDELKARQKELEDLKNIWGVNREIEKVKKLKNLNL